MPRACCNESRTLNNLLISIHLTFNFRLNVINTIVNYKKKIEKKITLTITVVFIRQKTNDNSQNSYGNNF